LRLPLKVLLLSACQIEEAEKADTETSSCLANLLQGQDSYLLELQASSACRRVLRQTSNRKGVSLAWPLHKAQKGKPFHLQMHDGEVEGSVFCRCAYQMYKVFERQKKD
jgi:hypothetical protein